MNIVLIDITLIDITLIDITLIDITFIDITLVDIILDDVYRLLKDDPLLDRLEADSKRIREMARSRV